MRAFLVGLLLTAAATAEAGTIKGVVAAPDGAKSGRRYAGYWHLENGVIPIQPLPAGKSDTVVVLEGAKGAQAPAAKTVTVEIAGWEASPRVLILGPGSVVEIKNADRVPHDLSVPEQPSFMPIERLNPGTLRRQKFLAAGGYLIRCAEYPHVTISVVVVETPHFAITDERGAFSIVGVPEGKATLKVWAGGRWAHEQAVEVGPKTSDLAIKPAPAARPTKDAAE